MLAATYLVALLGVVGFLFFVTRLATAAWRSAAHRSGRARPKSGIVYYGTTARPESAGVKERAA